MKVSKEFKIGIVVVFAIAAFVWGLSFLKGSNLFFEKSFLYAVYPKIENLNPSSPLQINGYQIGQIKTISLIQKDGQNLVLVKFLITEEIDIPRKSVAKVVSTNLLGGMAVELVFSKEKEFLKNGDTLVSETEQSFKEAFNRQLAPLQAKFENLISSVDTVMGVVNQVLNIKTRENINQSFESVRKAIFSLEQTAYKLDDLMATEKPKISSVLTNLSGITTNLNKNEQKITNILTNFSNLSDTLAKSQLKSAVANADNTLKELNNLLTKINQGQGTIGKLAKDDSLYNNLNKSAADLDNLLKDLKENPKRYVHFSLFGRKK
ncbi:MlaD family protein [Aurantibacillus circumpalustris]|uniref:MlaD family protein n=1 Tax=Aurantibacillus circumpalustris TaxID=3036359 RepID=UPI00295BC783|nr:MlaD family protein [Aurantibacillus circumpalustris]